ncbi:hypothetical protein P7C73_g3240, partial [Tremellales sp. Uapishka_1]
MSPRVFLITGTSTGFGNELVKVVLSKGDIAVATARNPDKLNFEGTNEKNYLPVRLDVTDPKSIDEAFKTTVDKFGRVDVVVNNAGYGLSGEFESFADDQIRTQMEVNFFGLINVTRKGELESQICHTNDVPALEIMRDLKTGGLIQQVTSMGGQVGVPTYSIYCASKWAVEGFTETLAQELKPEWNIKLSCIEPGGFRTDWAGRSMVFGERHPAYDHINAKANAEKRNGTQPGDPAKGAAAMYEFAIMQDPPLRAAVGTDAYQRIMKKLDTYKENYPKYEKLSNSTDVDE